jgi:hypothetical protein
MRRLMHVTGLCFLFSVLIAPVAQAQGLKAGHAQVQDQFIVIKSVKAPSQGWLVAYKDQGGQPGKIIGFTLINSGIQNAVRVPLLTGMLEPGAGIILMLHKDAGTKGMFHEPEDKPVVKGGKPMMVAVKIK